MKIKRWVAALLCVLLIGGLFPTRAFAADIPWYLDAEGVLHITGHIDESGFDLSDEQKQQVKSAVAASGASISSGELLFSGFKNMTSADLSLLNTTGVTDMRYMFYGCSRLISLDVSGFNTSSVTTMDGMFSGCSSLTSLDVSGFMTGNVTSMMGMFTNCSSLTSLYLSKFETGNVTQMSFMFNGCSSLTSLDLSKFITGNVTSMAAMFINCSGLTSLDLSSFDTSSVNNMGGMFEGCSSLTSLDVSGFKTDSLESAEEMFCGCSALASLGIRPDILYINAEDIIAICSSWQKQGSTDTYSTADELMAVTDTVTLLAMYTVNVQNDGNGTASANPAAAVKGETVTVTLTATPDTGYHFKEWQSSDVTVSGNTFTMPEKDVTVMAIFEADAPVAYTVTVETDGNGTASADPVSAAKGETVTLTATPDTGYHFKEWQSSDVTVIGNTFTMPEKDVAVMAIFEADAPAAYTVSFNMNGHGNQVTAQTVREGNKATRPADPTAEGWTFAGWYADDSLSKAFDFTAVISADTTVYAKWTDSLTINYEGDNIILSDGKGGLAPQNAAPGENIEFSAKAISGYKVKSVTVTTDGGKSVDVTDQGSGVYSFVMPDDNVTVKAEAESDGDDGQITKITPGTTSLTLKPGKTDTIKYTVEPAGATETVTFESSDPGVVTVDDKGVVTAVGLGTATITIKSASGKAMAKVTVTVDPFLYRMIRGDGQIVMQDAASAIFSSEANYGKFVAVEVDGKELGSGDFDSYSGSTIIELKAAFIRKLSLGIHTIRIISKDGYAMCKFTIKKLPETGDSSMTLLWTGCLVLALGGIVMLTRKRKVAR